MQYVCSDFTNISLLLFGVLNFALTELKKNHKHVFCSAVLVSWNHLMQMHTAVSQRACVAALKQEGLYAWHSALPCFNRASQML